MKWRLLEGGGQAYYELGVADSGALIGLSRADLDHSLETLEMMAGEIGASVIVVKEIEVPPVLVALADQLSGYIDPDTGEWADKMYSRRSRFFQSSDGELDSTPNTTETETDFEDDITAPSSFLVTPADMSRVTSPFPAGVVAQGYLTSKPERPSTQASPSLLPVDCDLALFSMEPEPEMQDADVPDLPIDPDPVDVTFDIEIASVYKPLPMRRRQKLTPGGPPPNHGKRSQKAKEKKALPWRTVPSSVEFLELGGVSKDDSNSLDRQTSKALQKRLARDKRREEKRKNLLASVVQAKIGVTEDSATLHESPRPHAEPDANVVERLEECAQEEVDGLVSGIEALHVMGSGLKPSLAVEREVDVYSVGREGGPELVITQNGPPSPTSTIVESQGPIPREPRLIVEALVVRKMSLEEAFLDFGGFSLI